MSYKDYCFVIKDQGLESIKLSRAQEKALQDHHDFIENGGPVSEKHKRQAHVLSSCEED